MKEILEKDSPIRSLIIVGDYGSGKTELAVNLSLHLAAGPGTLPIAIADLDLVNPYFRTREARTQLQELGIKVVLPHEQYMTADLPILSPNVAALIRKENLLAILETMNLTRRNRHRRANELIHQFNLDQVRRQQARLLSGGERRKLEIARALVSNPSLILLDEPFSGVDPIAVEDLQREIFQLRDKGISILITDHNVRDTLKITDTAYIINSGEILRFGTPSELSMDPEVRKIYLGEDFTL